MTLDANFLFLTLGLPAIGLTLINILYHFILWGVGSALVWLALGFLFLVGALSTMAMGTAWGNVFGFVCVVMAIGNFAWYISKIGKTKVSHTDKTGKMWSLWEKPPGSKKLTLVEQEKQRSQNVREKRRQEIRSAIDRAQSGKR